MTESQKAFDEMLANILRTIGSSKFWITLLIIVGVGITAWTQGGDLLKVIAAIIAFLTGGGFVVAKTYQNTHGENAATTIGAPSVALAAASPSVAMAVATGISTDIDTSSGDGAGEIITVKDKIAAMTNLANTDSGLKQLMLGVASTRIQEQVEHFKQLNPGSSDEAAINAIFVEYGASIMDPKRCEAAIAIVGMQGLLAASKDLTTVKSFIDAWEQGHYANTPQAITLERNFAIKALSLRIVEEAGKRVKDASLPIEQRKEALMEFGVSKEDADRSDFKISGVAVFKQLYDSNGKPIIQGEGNMVAFDQYVGFQFDQNL